jgi:hypothetical protein
MKLVISNIKTMSINLIVIYECKDFSNQMWGKQKTPLMRGFYLNPLGGVISTAPFSWFGQTLQLGFDIDTHLH